MGTPELGGTDGYSETCIERKIPGHGSGCREYSGQYRERFGFPAVLYGWKEVSLRRRRMGEAHGADREREGRDDLPAGRRGSAEELVADGDEHCHKQEFPREAGTATPRGIGPEADRAPGEYN